MTKKQRKAVRRALREPGSRAAGWNGVLEKARAYYAHTDPVCWELLRLRYMEGLREDAVIKALYIGRTTYYTKELGGVEHGGDLCSAGRAAAGGVTRRDGRDWARLCAVFLCCNGDAGRWVPQPGFR